MSLNEQDVSELNQLGLMSDEVIAQKKSRGRWQIINE